MRLESRSRRRSKAYAGRTRERRRLSVPRSMARTWDETWGMRGRRRDRMPRRVARLSGGLIVVKVREGTDWDWIGLGLDWIGLDWGIWQGGRDA